MVTTSQKAMRMVLVLSFFDDIIRNLKTRQEKTSAVRMIMSCRGGETRQDKYSADEFVLSTATT